MKLDTIFRFRQRNDLRKLLARLYEIDVFVSIGKVAAKRGYVFATALPGNSYTLLIENMYHPFVKNAVPNSVTITPSNNFLFLTGANMAGKSTFMKTLSTVIYLCHMGFPVPAKKVEFSVLDGMFTTINLPDNLAIGASHFYAEVLRVKKVVQELDSGKNLFIVFDELFRGTNVKDAYDGTIAISKGFARKKNSMFVISTHIVEAGEELEQDCANIHFVYLPTRMNGHKPEYTYRLENGITDDRHGMIIIKNEGILDMLASGLHQKQTL